MGIKEERKKIQRAIKYMATNSPNPEHVVRELKALYRHLRHKLHSLTYDEQYAAVDDSPKRDDVAVPDRTD